MTHRPWFERPAVENAGATFFLVRASFSIAPPVRRGAAGHLVIAAAVGLGS